MPYKLVNFYIYLFPHIDLLLLFDIEEARAGCDLKNRLREFFFNFCICNIHGIPNTFMCIKQYLTVIIVKRARSQNMCPIKPFLYEIYRGKCYLSH